MSIHPSKKLTTSHILGIDYGRSKVGLAIADSETRIASVYGVLDNDKNLLQKLAEIIEKEEISKVVIGILSDMGTKSPIGDLVPKDLINFLKEKLKIEVAYQNEMFSTREAHQNLKEKGMKGIKRFDDQEAARIILQSWLDRIT
jgi:putative holliday junction resolvase